MELEFGSACLPVWAGPGKQYHLTRASRSTGSETTLTSGDQIIEGEGII